ncbi:hypothetical protein CAI21_08945 [Alkalilimnicola ehrlichii]|uniref:Uncharacterized protein n=1 Tax=Alkalilimnicola ehrlichii TaxID=351052 RepID=A0A3E0WX81_9GAMM|nr:hypothetical protein [Alkalilimnicola ehrlichii]RFA29939.1 hypothetical protein CAI21_08945 [Alkalilimnicola ehrlichii]RFA36527.1 hypothetical protein CAL65_11215 [Alkalilimnicola ehrlichii]
MDTELREQLKANFRKEVFEVLDLISSKEEQLDYQAKAPIAYVSAELFNQWEDCYQTPKEQDWYKEAFSKAELKVFQEFDEALEAVSKDVPQNPPDIHDFVKTPEWEKLSNAARIALTKLQKI